MQFIKSKNSYIIRFESGENLIQELCSFCEKEGILGAFFSGIGALQSATLAFYNLENEQYEYKNLTGDYEIASLTGNVSIVNEEPFAHIHSVLSSDKFECVGGHLKEGIVGATCEIHLTKFDKKIERKMDEKVGLKLLDCGI